MSEECEVVFSVDADVPAGYTVFLTGNSSKLGDWDPLKGVEMKKDSSVEKRWSCTVSLPSDDYKYRYFVAKFNKLLMDADVEKTSGTPMTVLKWEANVAPRSMSVKDAKKIELSVAEFGSYDEGKTVGKGWLINQHEVQIRLHSNPGHLYPSICPNFHVKCETIDLYSQENSKDGHLEAGDHKGSVSDVFVSKLNPKECEPKEQSADGIEYQPDDYIIFRTQIPNLNRVGFKLKFYKPAEESDGSPELVGLAYLSSMEKLKSRSLVELPVVDFQNKQKGHIKVDVLKVSALQDVKLSMESSNQYQWTWGDGKPLDIGHRGLGVSFNEENTHKENTIDSYNAAFKAGAHLVEMDVLLTKDRHSILYHDFSVCVDCSPQEQGDEKLLHKVPVMDLTLSQLKKMQLYQAGKNPAQLFGPPSDDFTKQPFPSMVRCFESCDPELGFNIEVKYPQNFVNGVSEQDNFVDVNENLDHILKVVLEHSGNRKVVFSCFDPDTCAILQLKQNRFPVLLLHQGRTEVWDQFEDFRARTFLNGADYAVAENFMGMALNYEILEKDVALLTKLLARGLVCFVWNTNDTKNIARLRKLGAHALIYDRMDLNRPENVDSRGEGDAIPANGDAANGLPMKKQKTEALADKTNGVNGTAAAMEQS